jgi:hypothetical protein
MSTPADRRDWGRFGDRGCLLGSSMMMVALGLLTLWSPYETIDAVTSLRGTAIVGIPLMGFGAGMTVCAMTVSFIASRDALAAAGGPPA